MTTNLLEIWQHKLLHSRSKQQQQKQREHAVWQRQQQLMQQHMAKQAQLKELQGIYLLEGEGAAEDQISPMSSVGGAPMLF